MTGEEKWPWERCFVILGLMKALAVSLMACGISLFLAANANATELRIHFQNPDRSKASIEKADLILAGWGWIEIVPLNPDGDTVRLNTEILSTQFPEKFQNVWSAQIYVRGASLAAVQSEPFVWPGSARDSNRTDSTIDFRGGQSVALRIGDSKEMTVVMRQPQNRSIRLLDDDGKPIAGLKVSVIRFESNENHCGFLWGEELKAGSTDANGRLAVPDGDFKYGIKLDYGSHYNFSFQASSPNDPETYVTLFLTQPETVFPIHRFAPVRLAIRVLVGNAAASEVWFTDSRNIGICGAATGLLGKTGSDGRLLVEKYFPEERDGICIVDDQGKLLWGKESKDLLQISRNPIEIRFPAGTKFGQTDTPCPFP